VVYLEIKKKKLRLKKAVALVDAVADASAEEVTQKMLLPLKCKVVVVDADASRANPVVALESTLADTAGEFLVYCGR
jgi:hypothetical protein